MRRLIDEEDTSPDSPWGELIELVRAMPHLSDRQPAKLRIFARIAERIRAATLSKN
jgi:hypothetical protein